MALIRRPSVTLRLLGRYEIALEGEAIAPPATAKARSLLAYLALRSGEPIRRETLMSEFWPDADTTSARNNLKTTLSSIRRIFKDRGASPDDVLEVTRETVRWLAMTLVDSREFAACSLATEQGRSDALGLYAGELLPGDSNEWAHEQRQSLALHFENMLRAELAAAPTPATAERLLALDPYCEEAYLALAECALAEGNRRKAQAVYHRYAAALAEVGGEPPRDLAERVGLRAAAAAAAEALGFFGRSHEFAQLESLVECGARAIVVTGCAGIGKSAFIAQARRRFPGVAIHESVVDGAPLDVESIELGPLANDEIALALRRSHPHASAEAIDALQRRSGGHPEVLLALVAQLERLNASETALIARMRLPRAIERRFEALLAEAGADCAQAAVLLALEPRLDDDDLAALLDWTTTRVIDVRERLADFGAAMPHVLEAALRTLSTSRRSHTIERIAQRLKLHENPAARSDAARLLVELGRHMDAANAYLEAARAYHAAVAWENGIRAVDSGLLALESLSASEAVNDVARELYLLKGRCLYQQGWFLASTHALESVLEISDANAHRAIRAKVLVLIGNALARMDAIQPAFEIARQAVEEAPPGSSEDFTAHHLLARVLRDRVEYDESIEVASRTFERSMRAREWSSAVNSAHLVIDVSRRLLRIDTAFAWSSHLIDAGLLAGPVLEAEARHMVGALRALMNDFDGALEAFRHALALVEMYRRRRSTSATPVGQLEWMLHYSIAHTHVRAGNVEQATAESEWLLRSPWVRNRANCWQAVSLAVNARLASGTERDIAAARAVLERMPAEETDDPRAVLDTAARARLAAACGDPDAPRMLHVAFEGLRELARVHADQVYPYYDLLAASARGIDDLLSARASESARGFERRLSEAAGPLWHGSAPQPLRR
ncbi:MAG: winged helix-turn-helix domain-containing protein [bacterium]|nr:winged helix-turn-helix domain-containing protein [bacterium]